MAADRECAGDDVARVGTVREGEAMTDPDDIREQQEKSAETNATALEIRKLLEAIDTRATALKIRELLESLEADWGDEAAELALAIVTGDQT
jgi:hypothetical protein